MKRFFKSFGFAAKGLTYSIATQLNFKIHLLASFMVVVAGWHFRISVAEWLAIVLCVGAVLVTELINTAIETLVDMVSPEFNAKAGLVKDIAAAAVLIAAIMAVIVALIIFVPKM